MKINDFRTDLEYSKQDTEYIDAAYRMRYSSIGGGVLEIKRASDMNTERKGIDTIITLKNGRRILVQEKRRRANPRINGSDILIEMCSVCKNYTGKYERSIEWFESQDRCFARGWINHLQSDVISFAFDSVKKAYVYDVISFQLAWERNKHTWVRDTKNKIIIAYNIDYVTMSIAIPRLELEDAMNAVRSCSYGGVADHKQKTFDEM